MKKFFSIIIFSLMSLDFFASSRGEQELIKAGHWVYDSLAAVCTESNSVYCYDEAPLTVQQIKMILDRIDYESLSSAGKKNYDSIISYFNEKKWTFGSEDFNVGFSLRVIPEAQYKTNEDVQWVYDRKQRSPFVDSSIDFKCHEYFFGSTDIIVAQSQSARLKNDNYVNVPYSMETVDINFPHNAYLSAGFMFNETSGINMRLGVLSKDYGRSSIGSAILSRNLYSTPEFNLNIYSDLLSYQTNITMLGFDRYFYFHNFSIKPTKKLSLSILEGALPYGSMDLRYCIPFTFFHGYAGWWDYKNKANAPDEEYDVASYLGLKINYTPVKYLRTYFIFAMNQFQMPNEDDRSIPSGYAAQLGLESFIPLKEGYLHIGAEAYYAVPYFMITESPNWSFVKTYKETCDNSATFYEWIGSPLGPDTIAFKLDAGYEVKDKWGVNFSYLFAACGELSNPDFCGWGGYDYDFFSENRQLNWVYPKNTNNDKYKNGAALASPTGTPEFRNIVSFKCDYWPESWLCITAYPGAAFIFNRGHEEGKFDLSFEFALCAKFDITKLSLK